MKKRFVFIGFLFIVLSTSTLGVVCTSDGWGVPQLSTLNTIKLDGVTWEAVDTFNDQVYRRSIMPQGKRGITPTIDPDADSSVYLTTANNFLERNYNELKIFSFSEMSFGYDGDYPVVDFLGQTQICYGLTVIGTFNGVVGFDGREVHSINSKWYSPIELDITESELNALVGSAVGGGAGGGGGGGGGNGTKKINSSIKILPTGNGKFSLVTEVIGENGTISYMDARNGNVVGYLVEDVKGDKRIVIARPFPIVRGIFAAVITLILILAIRFFWFRKK